MRLFKEFFNVEGHILHKSIHYQKYPSYIEDLSYIWKTCCFLKNARRLYSDVCLKVNDLLKKNTLVNHYDTNFVKGVIKCRTQQLIKRGKMADMM